jgi:hypothetical protein
MCQSRQVSGCGKPARSSPCALTACCCAEDLDGPASKQQYVPGKEKKQSGIPCYDPSTMQHLGYAKAMTPQEVIAVLPIGERMRNEARRLTDS